MASVWFKCRRCNRQCHDLVVNTLSTLRWAQPLYLPLLAVEALLTTGLELQFCLVVLVCPLFYLIMTELLHKHVRNDMLDLSAVLSALAVCYAAYSAQVPSTVDPASSIGDRF